MGKPIIWRIHLLLNLLVAILVAPAEKGKNCPFKTPVKCKRLDSQDSQFPPTEVTMVEGSASVAYTCDSKIRFKKLNLNRLSHNDMCKSFQYQFDGDKLRISMKPIKASKHITSIAAEHINTGIWQVNMEARRHGGEVGIVMPIQFDIGREKLMVPTRFRTELEAECQKRMPIVFNFKESGSMHDAFTIPILPCNIEYHGRNTWIFGRAAMKLFELSFMKIDGSTFRIQIGPPEKNGDKECVRGTVIPSGNSQQLRSTEPDQSAVMLRSWWAYCCVGEATATPTTRHYYYYGSSSDSDCCCGCDTGSDCCCQCDQMTECCSAFFENIACDIEPEVACDYACSFLCCILGCLCDHDDWKRALTENQRGWA